MKGTFAVGFSNVRMFLFAIVSTSRHVGALEN